MSSAKAYPGILEVKNHPSQHSSCVDDIEIHEGLVEAYAVTTVQPEVTVAEGPTAQPLRLEIGKGVRHSTAGRARRREDGFGVTGELIL